MAYDPTTDGGKLIDAKALSASLQQVKGKLSKVALSNSYNDLDDKLKAGDNITITEDGTISAQGGEAYTLPAATATALGGVKVGDNLSITEDGVLSAQEGGSTYTAGNGITIEDGVINAPFPDFTTLFKDTPVPWDVAATYAKDVYVYGNMGSDDDVVMHDFFVYQSLHDDNTGNMPVLTGHSEHWKLVGQLPMFYLAANLPEDMDNCLPLLYPDIQELSDGAKTFGFTTHTVFIEKNKGLEFSVKDSRLYLNTASGSKLGGVKIGDNVHMDSDGTISVPRATVSSLGVTWPGEGLSIDSHDAMTLQPATATAIGGVRAGDGLTITEDGTLSAASYTLPAATATALGGVKVGDNLSITEDGTLSAASGLPECTEADKGKFLAVDSTGAPAWTSVPNAEEASF